MTPRKRLSWAPLLLPALLATAACDSGSNQAAKDMAMSIDMSFDMAAADLSGAVADMAKTVGPKTYPATANGMKF
jgi:hypothetical protein